MARSLQFVVILALATLFTSCGESGAPDSSNSDTTVISPGADAPAPADNTGPGLPGTSMEADAAVADSVVHRDRGTIPPAEGANHGRTNGRNSTFDRTRSGDTSKH